jgi:hypothetical protein
MKKVPNLKATDFIDWRYSEKDNLRHLVYKIIGQLIEKGFVELTLQEVLNQVECPIPNHLLDTSENDEKEYYNHEVNLVNDDLSPIVYGENATVEDALQVIYEAEEPVFIITTADVYMAFDCTQEEAYEVIDALNDDEYIGGEVNSSLITIGEGMNLKRKKKEGEEEDE